MAATPATRHELAELRCPHCDAARPPRSVYCVECGSTLAPTTGPLASLRRFWVRHAGWYPGDWIWLALLTLAVAVAGAIAAVAVARGREHTPAAIVATSAGVTPRPARTAGTRRNGRLAWPPGRTGWTIVIASYPLPAGREAARTTAARATSRGLRQVGTLDSSGYPSLVPGYAVVWSGIFPDAASAAAALPGVRRAGFGVASTRLIAR